MQEQLFVCSGSLSITKVLSCVYEDFPLGIWLATYTSGIVYSLYTNIKHYTIHAVLPNPTSLYINHSTAIIETITPEMFRETY